MAAPLALLEGYQGVLQTDGYRVYRQIGEREGMVHMGCWAHARRKFDEAVKAQGRNPRKAGRAYQGLAWIQKLYRIERSLKQATPKPATPPGRNRPNPCCRNCAPGWITHWRRRHRKRHRQGAPLPAGRMAPADPLSGRRGNPHRQQLGRKRDPSLCRGPQELAVQPQRKRGPGQRQPLQPGANRQGQSTGALPLPAPGVHRVARASSVEQIEALLPGNVTITPAPTTPPQQG